MTVGTAPTRRSAQRLSGLRPRTGGRRPGPEDELSRMWQEWLGRGDAHGQSPPLTADQVLHLQSTAGNNAVTGLLEGGRGGNGPLDGGPAPGDVVPDGPVPDGLVPDGPVPDGLVPDGSGSPEVQRAVPGPDEAAEDGALLTYSLFQNDPYLEAVARGEALLAPGTPAAGPVRLLQAALLLAVPEQDLGPTGLGGAGLDGDFGPKTEQAVRAFQAAQGLVADGVVGPLTIRRLDEVLVHRAVLDDDPDAPPKGDPFDPSRRNEEPKGSKLPKMPSGGNMGDLSGFGVSILEVDPSEPDGGPARMEGEPVEKPNVHLRGSAGANLEVGYALVPRKTKGTKGKPAAPTWGAEVKYLLVHRDIEVDSKLPSMDGIGCTLAADDKFLRNREALTKTGDVGDLDLMSTLDWTTKDATHLHESLHTQSFHNTIRFRLEHKYRKAVAAIAEPDKGADGLEPVRARFREVTKHEIQLPWRGLEQDDRTAWHSHWDIRLAQFYFLVQQYNHWLEKGSKGGCKP